MKASLRQALEERSAELDGDIAQAAAEVSADTGTSESLRAAGSPRNQADDPESLLAEH